MSVLSIVVLVAVFVHLTDGVLISRGHEKAIKASSIHDLGTIKQESNLVKIIYFHDVDLDHATQEKIDSKQKANAAKAHFFTMEISESEKPKFKEEFPTIVQLPAIVSIKLGQKIHMQQGEDVNIDKFEQGILSN
ncbi:hypothetical protein DdX_16704 [Ditylenchus destructor]|uniref:Uncharacterized protein n=1 Tax=Ditylenchus destructor TaxID=166010 RepID=A0AAD4MNI3_9BILA|nr:hypothetical protein DdX_16704 [Ditylenchus destructor]